MNRTYVYVAIAVALIAALAAAVFLHARKAEAPGAVVATASYLCRDGKAIDATYRADGVTLTLSDTRALVLPQVRSGSGIRYEKDGAVFASKGDNAFLEENGTQTYADCVATGSPASDATEGMKQFADSAGTFSFSYPSTVTVSGGGIGYTQAWMNNATSSGLLLAKAVLGKAFQPGTNFSEATFTVGTSADPSAVSGCLTYNPTGGPATSVTTKTVNGVTYTVLRSAGAGAGNLYETTSYRTLRNNQCYAIEYTVHSTNLGNYDPSQHVTAFDEAAVTGVMEGIIASFRFTDGA